MSGDADLLEWLADPAAHDLAPDEEVGVVETPGCRVFLAGSLALKVKKPVDLGFLDFSTLDKRRASMEVELGLNRRTAPAHYLRIAEITRANGGFAFDGAGEVAEVALVMKRFPQDALLSRVAEREGLSDRLAEEIGDVVAQFHCEAQLVAVEGAAAMRRNTGVNARSLTENAHVFPPGAVERLLAATDAEIEARAGLINARGKAGWVRRVHGDLHLENIFLDEAGRPTPFDAVEFDPLLATVDVVMDLAFVLMDLVHIGQARAANRLLNVWLDRMARIDAEAAYSGLALLPLCMSSRAAVRAHVRARLSTVLKDEAADQAAAEARGYLARAQAWLAPPEPRLIAIGGRSGTGKSTLAKALAVDAGGPAGAIIVRTDEVRKRLFNAAPQEALPKSAYAPETHAAVYEACHEAARWALGAGATVILDAAFLDPAERVAAETVATESDVPFAGLWLDAPDETLLARVAARADDASDADAEVVRAQLARDLGTVTWRTVDASGEPDAALNAARAAL